MISSITIIVLMLQFVKGYTYQDFINVIVEDPITKPHDESNRDNNKLLINKSNVLISNPSDAGNDVARRSEFITAVDRDNELAEEPYVVNKTKTTNKTDRFLERTLKYFLGNLKNKDELINRGNVLIDTAHNNSSTRNAFVQFIQQKIANKKHLSKLFSRFVVAMAGKLELDPLDVADTLVTAKRTHRNH